MKTAEAVTPGHPDKMCDQISDAVLDWALGRDPKARVAIEAMGGHGRVFILGEMTIADTTDEELEDALHEIVDRIAPGNDLDWQVAKQSPEIANGVDTGGAGDQGIMIGYACRENKAMIPQEAYLARSLAQYLYKKWPNDGKTQITLDENGLVHTIVASFQSAPKAELEERVMEWVGEHEDEVRKGLTLHVNPAGDWEQGGFDADTGLTGRKLMVDNYGPQVAIGGGAFSGKDATKVDRSAAYMARKIAVDYLNKFDTAKEITVKLAYAIGVAEPVMAEVRIDENLTLSVEGYDLTPAGIIAALDLRKPQYEETAKWGHFGNGFAWDK